MADLGGWAKIEQELYGPKGLWTSIFAANRRRESVGEVAGDGLGHREDRAAGAPDLVLRGTTLFYLGLMVILPMAALVVEAARPGASAFWEAVRDPLRLARAEADVRHRAA